MSSYSDKAIDLPDEFKGVAFKIKNSSCLQITHDKPFPVAEPNEILDIPTDVIVDCLTNDRVEELRAMVVNARWLKRIKQKIARVYEC